MSAGAGPVGGSTSGRVSSATVFPPAPRVSPGVLHPSSGLAPARFPPARASATLPAVIDHVSLQVADVDAAAAFYIRVFAPLGVREAMRHGSPDGAVVGLCGPDGYPHLWLGGLGGDGAPPGHPAPRAPAREAGEEGFPRGAHAGAGGPR